MCTIGLRFDGSPCSLIRKLSDTAKTHIHWGRAHVLQAIEAVPYVVPLALTSNCSLKTSTVRNRARMSASNVNAYIVPLIGARKLQDETSVDVIKIRPLPDLQSGRTRELPRGRRRGDDASLTVDELSRALGSPWRRSPAVALVATTGTTPRALGVGEVARLDAGTLDID